MASFISGIGRGIKKSVSGTSGFFRGSIQELKKVRWPSRKEMVSYTTVVLSICIVLTIFFFIIDLGIAEIVKLIMK
ncbi:preprotein translocase subunit SecE [Thermoflavimicrobium daqui]|jgi:preprotein translocase subunit SecE|uniref:Protein translocase subunit SecE n=1 Tax=Thermoflavimicrobium daqui TaxID=2137476 RepID=A0A364K334_9BACL|nr:preprotein translocase subunit SecE [Thermoflavimicrobium daqui]RAL23233.1 preprotein translocase subunit SecE [Thermoflavimicrobium daqui]